MKYKLFLTDYDGTLGSGDYIDEGTVKAIKEYQSAGGKFVLCTGRSYKSILPILNKYDLTGDVIAFQGAVICDIKTGKPIYDGEVDRAKILDIYSKLQSEGLSCGMYIGDYVNYDNANEYMKEYIRYVGAHAIKVDNLIETVRNTDKKIRKLIGLGDSDTVSRLQKKYSKEYEGSLIVNTSSHNLLEAVNPLNSKGESVRRIAKYYNIPLTEVITVGDSLNDIELVRGEWHGVAVGDAVSELKEVAKEITLPFKENPVKHLLQKYEK